jgi:hypothetical protein
MDLSSMSLEGLLAEKERVDGLISTYGTLDSAYKVLANSLN